MTLSSLLGALPGAVFQDPMMGTAATMGIEENLALAKRRGKVRTLRTGITRAEREEYRELLKTLGLGLEDLMHEFEKASGEIFASDKALLG